MSRSKPTPKRKSEPNSQPSKTPQDRPPQGDPSALWAEWLQKKPLRFFDTLAGQRLTGIVEKHDVTPEGQRVLHLKWPAVILTRAEPLDQGKEFVIKTRFEPLPHLGASCTYLLYAARICGESTPRHPLFNEAYIRHASNYVRGLYDLGPYRNVPEVVEVPDETPRPEAAGGSVVSNMEKYPVPTDCPCEHNAVGDVTVVNSTCPRHGKHAQGEYNATSFPAPGDPTS